jgi:hypothetical protein
MSTNRLRPELIPADPGPWAIVSFAREAQGARLIGRGGRRRQTPAALLSDFAPEIPLDRPGLDASLGVAGAGPIRLVAVSREGARSLWFEDDGATLRGVHPRVVRRWSVPDLEVGTPDYPDTDPAATLPPPVAPERLVEPVEGEVVAPGGRVSAAPVKHGRLFGVALLRVPERELVRFIGGAACAAWTEDAQTLAFGGDWGVLLAVPAPESPSAPLATS